VRSAVAGLLAAVLVGCGAGAFAQSPRRAPAPAPAPGAPDKRTPDQLRTEVLERMRALRAWRIVDELKLDESASARLFPILAKYDEQELKLSDERRDIAREIKTLLAAPKPDDAKLNAALDRMLANRKKRIASKDERIKEVRKVLTPVQQAKLVLLLPRLEREFARSIQDVAEGHDDHP
jgi:Spy/CpxP family protein refolding chaperone